jgi:hypothetical protein
MIYQPRGLPDYYEIKYTQPTPGDLHFVEGVVADLKYPGGFGDIDPEELSVLGEISHVLVDLDGTLSPFKTTQPFLPASHFSAINGLADRFNHVCIATENGQAPNTLIRALGIGAIINEADVFSSHYNVGAEDRLRYPRWKTNPQFWRYLLKTIGMLDSPERVVMIGDSPVRDIETAQAQGIKTVQVGRLEVIKPTIAQLLAKGLLG